MDQNKKFRTTITVDSELKKLSQENNINISRAAELGIKLIYGIDDGDLEWIINQFKKNIDREKLLEMKNIRDDLEFRKELDAKIKLFTEEYEKMIDKCINPFNDDSFWLGVKLESKNLNISQEAFTNLLLGYINGKYYITDLKNMSKESVDNIGQDEGLIRDEKDRIYQILIKKILYELNKKFTIIQSHPELRSRLGTEYTNLIKIGAYALNIPTETFQIFCEQFSELNWHFRKRMSRCDEVIYSFTREQIIHFSSAENYEELKTELPKMCKYYF